MVQRTTAVRLLKNGNPAFPPSNCYLFNSCLHKQDKLCSPITSKI